MQAVPPPHLIVTSPERLSLAFLASYLRWMFRLFGDAFPQHQSNPRLLAHFQRVSALSYQFDRLIARFRAGTLRPYKPRQSGPLPARHDRPRHTVPAQPGQASAKFPTRFGWLLRGVGWPCAYVKNALAEKLDDAEMQALIAAAPGQSRRLLRPFCHLVGTKPPPSLALPRRKRAAAKPAIADLHEPDARPAPPKPPKPPKPRRSGQFVVMDGRRIPREWLPCSPPRPPRRPP